MPRVPQVVHGCRAVPGAPGEDGTCWGSGVAMKPAQLGTVWAVSARLYNREGVLVGYCNDTPNAIATAMKEHLEVMTVRSLLGFGDRADYEHRMNYGCPSGYQAVK